MVAPSGTEERGTLSNAPRRSSPSASFNRAPWMAGDEMRGSPALRTSVMKMSPGVINSAAAHRYAFSRSSPVRRPSSATSVSPPMMPSRMEATASSEGDGAAGTVEPSSPDTGGGTYSFTLSMENILAFPFTSSHTCLLLQLTTRYGPSHLSTGFSRYARTSMAGLISATAARGT